MFKIHAQLLLVYYHVIEVSVCYMLRGHAAAAHAGSLRKVEIERYELRLNTLPLPCVGSSKRWKV